MARAADATTVVYSCEDGTFAMTAEAEKLEERKEKEGPANPVAAAPVGHPEDGWTLHGPSEAQLRACTQRLQRIAYEGKSAPPEDSREPSAEHQTLHFDHAGGGFSDYAQVPTHPIYGGLPTPSEQAALHRQDKAYDAAAVAARVTAVAKSASVAALLVGEADEPWQPTAVGAWSPFHPIDQVLVLEETLSDMAGVTVHLRKGPTQAEARLLPGAREDKGVVILHGYFSYRADVFIHVLPDNTYMLGHPTLFGNGIMFRSPTQYLLSIFRAQNPKGYKVSDPVAQHPEDRLRDPRCRICFPSAARGGAATAPDGGARVSKRPRRTPVQIDFDRTRDYVLKSYSKPNVTSLILDRDHPGKARKEARTP